MLKGSIKKKLVLTLGSVSLFVILCMGLGVYFYVREIVVANRRDELERSVVDHTNELRQIFTASFDLVDTISGQDDVTSYLSADTKEAQNPDILKILEDYNIGNNYSAIYLMDIEGDTLVSTDERFVGQNYSFRAYFIDAIDGIAGIDAVRGVTSKEIGFYFSNPVRDQEGEIIGVVVAKLIPESVYSAVELTFYTEAEVMYFVDEYGVILYSTNGEKIFKSLGEFTQEEKKEIDESRRYEGLEIEPLDYDQVQDDLKTLWGAKSYEIYDEVDSRSEVVSVGRVEGLPFFVIVDEDLELFLAPTKRFALYVSLFSIFSVLLIVGVLIIIINRFFRPLGELERAANEIGEGNYNVEIGIENNKDEFSVLARTFRNMINGIKKRNKMLEDAKAGLEKKVEKRTEELEGHVKKIEELNDFMIGREEKMVELKNELEECEEEKRSKDE